MVLTTLGLFLEFCKDSRFVICNKQIKLNLFEHLKICLSRGFLVAVNESGSMCFASLGCVLMRNPFQMWGWGWGRGSSCDLGPGMHTCVCCANVLYLLATVILWQLLSYGNL